MRSSDQKIAIQQQIDDLTEQLKFLQADLNSLVEQEQQHSNDEFLAVEPRSGRHQFDQDGNAIYANDIVSFRPPGTRSGSAIQTRGVIVRFTAQRVYIRRENDQRKKPQEILRDPAHTRLITSWALANPALQRKCFYT